MPAGTLVTVAGTGTNGYNGDGIAATSAQIGPTIGLWCDPNGDLYLADGARIRKVNAATGLISTLAGTGVAGYSGDGGPATSATLNLTMGLCADGAGNVYFTDGNNGRVRKVDSATGIVTTIAGTGVTGFSGDGGPATAAKLSVPAHLCMNNAGDLYIADQGNLRVRRVAAATGTITTVVGNGTAIITDGMLATNGGFVPFDVKLDAAENLYIIDIFESRIRKVDRLSGLISTVAGLGGGTTGYNGDGIPATSASLTMPLGIWLDPQTNIYIAEHVNSRLRMVDASTGIISTIVGNGTFGYSPDGTPATSAMLANVYRPTSDCAGNLYFVDASNFRIRMVQGGAAPCGTLPPTPTPSSTPTPTITPSPSPSPSASQTSTCTPSWTSSPSPSASPTQSISPTITATFTSSPTPTPAPPALSLKAYPPNPDPAGDAGTWLPFVLGAPAWVELKIYNISGELLLRTPASALSEGSHEFHWDLKNQSGARAASGIYLGRLHASSDRGEEASAWVRFAVIR